MKKVNFTTPRELVKLCVGTEFEGSRFEHVLMNPTPENIKSYQKQKADDSEKYTKFEAAIIARICELSGPNPGNWDAKVEAWTLHREATEDVYRSVKDAVNVIQSAADLMTKANRVRLENYIDKTDGVTYIQTPLIWTLNNVYRLINRAHFQYLGGDDFTIEDRDELLRLCAYGNAGYFDGMNYEKKEALQSIARRLAETQNKIKGLHAHESERDVLKGALKSKSDAVRDSLNDLTNENPGRASARHIENDIKFHIQKHAGKETFNPDLLIAFFIGLSSISYANDKGNVDNKKTLKGIEILLEDITLLSKKLNQ
jgi:hypothetical protein